MRVLWDKAGEGSLEGGALTMPFHAPPPPNRPQNASTHPPLHPDRVLTLSFHKYGDDFFPGTHTQLQHTNTHATNTKHTKHTTDRVLTVSFHKYGDDFFPGTGGPEEVGVDRGRHYAVNVPLDVRGRAGGGDVGEQGPSAARTRRRRAARRPRRRRRPARGRARGGPAASPSDAGNKQNNRSQISHNRPRTAWTTSPSSSCLSPSWRRWWRATSQRPWCCSPVRRAAAVQLWSMIAMSRLHLRWRVGAPPAAARARPRGGAAGLLLPPAHPAPPPPCARARRRGLAHRRPPGALQPHHQGAAADTRGRGRARLCRCLCRRPLTTLPSPPYHTPPTPRAGPRRVPQVHDEVRTPTPHLQPPAPPRRATPRATSS